MAIVYLPGSSRSAGKLNWPLSSVTTVVAMVEPSFLAVTSTPSIVGSWLDDTLPLNAATLCACAVAQANPAARTTPRLSPATGRKPLDRILTSRIDCRHFGISAGAPTTAVKCKWPGRTPAIAAGNVEERQSSGSTFTIDAP